MHKLSIQTTVFTASQADGVPTRPKADIHDQKPNVRFGSLADTQRPEDFRMT